MKAKRTALEKEFDFMSVSQAMICARCSAHVDEPSRPYDLSDQCKKACWKIRLVKDENNPETS